MTLTPVTPDDANDLALVTRAIHVAGVGGALKITPEGSGTPVTIYIGLGGLFPVRASRIWATGTSATGIVAVA